MLIGLLLMVVALAANIWLWGQWSFEESADLNKVLYIDTLLLVYIFVFPLVRILKKKTVKKAVNFWPIKVSFYAILCLTVILCVSHFYGFIRYILFAKFVLTSVYVYLKYKKKFFSKKETKSI